MFIMMMFAYSARKNRANGPAAYSTLNPETSSDSPSVRSNGARLVSANVEMNHIMAKGHDGKINHRYSWVVISVDSVNDPDRKSTRLNSSHANISYAVFCLKKKKNYNKTC